MPTEPTGQPASREDATAALQGLARAVSFDPDLRVVVGAVGGGWSLDVRRREIRCDPADLDSIHADDIRGLVCHEAAHAAVTRYPALVPPSLLTEPGMAPLLNALEDCRIETWLRGRFPGTASWIERTNERLVPMSLEDLGSQPLVHQFCIAAMLDWWQGLMGRATDLPPGLDPRVAAALGSTEEARHGAIDAQPPDDVLGVPDVAYAGSMVARRFVVEDRRRPPDAFERAVRMASWTFWKVVHRGVWPHVQALAREDRSRPGRAKEEAEFLRQLRGLAEGGGGAPRRDVGSGAGIDPVTVERLVRGDLDLSDGDPYESARRRVAGLIDATSRALMPLATRARMPSWGGAHATGAKVDLRRVVQAQADPRRPDGLWLRKSLPKRHDPVVHLLIDLSGSMAGARIETAWSAVVLLCEVMHRLRLPFAVSGFQDRRIEVKAARDPLDAATRRRVGALPLEVMGRRPGGNNRPEENHDGPALRDAARALLAHPARDRWLWVISDGLPTGPADGAQPLHRAVADLVTDGRIRLVGIGLGPGTQHVADFYPEGLPEVPLEGLPDALGRLLRRLV